MLRALFGNGKFTFPLAGLTAYIDAVKRSLDHFDKVLILIGDHHICRAETQAFNQCFRVVFRAYQNNRQVSFGASNTLENILGGNLCIVLSGE